MWYFCVNFGNSSSSSGFGIRDNSGAVEYKNSGYSWIGIQPKQLDVYPLVLATPAMTGNTITVSGQTYIVSASSQYGKDVQGKNYSAYSAFDQNEETDWAVLGTNGVSYTLPSWIQIQLPSPMDIKQIWMRGRISNEIPTSYTIQSSNDGTTFTNIPYNNQTVFSFLSSNNNTTKTSSFIIPSGYNNQTFYRMYFTTYNSGAVNPGLNEVRLLKKDNTVYPLAKNSVCESINYSGTNIVSKAIVDGRWGYVFTSNGGFVKIKASVTSMSLAVDFSKL